MTQDNLDSSISRVWGRLVGEGSCLGRRQGAHLSPIGRFPCVRVEERFTGVGRGSRVLPGRRRWGRKERAPPTSGQRQGLQPVRVRFRGRQVQQELPLKWYKILEQDLETAAALVLCAADSRLRMMLGAKTIHGQTTIV